MIRKSIWSIYANSARILPASVALSLEFLRTQRRWPSLDNPRSFNEKIQHRKLSGDPAAFAVLADKIDAKQVVSQIIGAEFVTPTLWCGHELDFEALRKLITPFVLKSSRGSGRNVFIDHPCDIEAKQEPRIVEQLKSRRYPPLLHEPWYDLVQHRYLAEQRLGMDLNDYKVYVFHGTAQFIHVDIGRFACHERAFFDRDWKCLPFGLKYPVPSKKPARPQELNLMLELAERIAGGCDFLRVDFYEVNGRPRFGEVTFAPGSGFERFTPREYDIIVGRMW